MLNMGIIAGLEIAGMVSGGYIGYRYGDRMKTYCCNKAPLIEKFRKDYVNDRFKNSQVSESGMFNMVGSLTGVYLGSKFWFISIPIIAYHVAEEYPEEYKKLKNYRK